MIAHDIEFYKDGKKHRLSDNIYTRQSLRLVSYDVKGAGYKRNFDDIDRVNGRFYNYETEEKKVVTMKVRYEVEQIAHVTHLKARLQALLHGHFYLRELATNDATIQYEDIFDKPQQDFQLEYVDGKQIFVGLTTEISIPSETIAGEFTLEFETIELPYFESIDYNTEMPERTAISEAFIFNEGDSSRKHTFYNIKVGDYYYHGTANIDQFNQDLIVECTLGENISKTDKQGFNFYMTDSDVIRISGIEMRAGDVIKFDGLHTYRNGLNIDDANNNLQQPVLTPGWNTFHSTKTLQKIKFKHKCYYR